MEAGEQCGEQRDGQSGRQSDGQRDEQQDRQRDGQQDGPHGEQQDGPHAEQHGKGHEDQHDTALRDTRVLNVALDALAWAAGQQIRGSEMRSQALAFMSRPVNVAVAGRSGSGKSSFINALIGLSPGTLGAADVGVLETTMQPGCYEFPNMPNFKLWDIPGADTKEFASETYIRSMGLTHFDMVVIIVLTPYTGTERSIAEELRRCGIPHFVVRSKVDIDIDNNLSDHDIEEPETLAAIREDMLGHEIERPYLVSARRPHGLDMDRLMQDLVQTVFFASSELDELREEHEQREIGNAPPAPA